jgi:hypothetical protein
MLWFDQTNHSVLLENKPRRIVSLVPSQTEYFFDLGLDSEVIGITKFCIHPKEWRKTKTIVGGTKKLSIAKIKALNPDLVIGNKEENNRADIEAIREFCPVWLSDVSSLDDAYDMMSVLGEMVEKQKKATDIINDIKAGFKTISSLNVAIHALYFIWKNPYMVAGSNTFIDSLLSECNISNALGDKTRYPEIALKEVDRESINLILLSSEPFPFKERDKKELEECFPGIPIEIVDGELFSWYGSRLSKSPMYYNQIIDKINRLNA